MAIVIPIMAAQHITNWKSKGLRVTRKQTMAASITVEPKKKADEKLGIKPNPEKTNAKYIRLLMPKNLVIQM